MADVCPHRRIILTMGDAQKVLAELCRQIAALDYVILSEGNAAAREDETTFWVKASGEQMANVQTDSLVKVSFEPLVRLLRAGEDSGPESALTEANQTPERGQPSVESFMHAALLTHCGANFSLHSHPIPILALACLPNIEHIVVARLFPDDAVFCGPATCLVPYVDPGLPLAKEIIKQVDRFKAKHDGWPKVILLQNHGLITLGQTANEAMAAHQMAVKAAQVWLAALAASGDVAALPQDEVKRILSREDEKRRQKMLWGDL